MTRGLDRHVVATRGTLGGKPRIAGRRLSIEDIAIWQPEAAVKPLTRFARNKTLTLAEVHAALAYYYDHQAEIEREINEGDAFLKA